MIKKINLRKKIFCIKNKDVIIAKVVIVSKGYYGMVFRSGESLEYLMVHV